MKLFTPLSVFFAFGIFVSTANTASAQSFLEGGSIRMGGNGPVGTLNTSVGNFRVGSNGVSGAVTTGINGLNGRINVGPGGGNINTSLGNFGFDLPGESGIVSSPNQGAQFGAGGGVGPQGQRPGGYSSGIGSFGGAGTSQAVMGDQTHDSDYTSTKFQGNSQKTRKQNNSIFERVRNNNLATFSVDPSAVPSASFDYGFPSGLGGWAGTARGAFTRGWYLPPTSTASFDGNTVSP